MLVRLARGACAPEEAPKDTAEVVAPSEGTFTRIDDEGLGSSAQAALARMPA